MQKILQCYPFKNLGILLTEGFTEYDGVLGRDEGKEHNGIDYVLRLNGNYISFEVFSMHEGEAFSGVSQSWGNFVAVRSHPFGSARFDTIYAHLENIPLDIPMLPKATAGSTTRELKGLQIPACFKLGVSGTSGQARGIIQLHIELHEKNLQIGNRKKLDPYGVYDRVSSGKYRQPGESLEGLHHYWLSDEPAFAE